MIQIEIMLGEAYTGQEKQREDLRNTGKDWKN